MMDKDLVPQSPPEQRELDKARRIPNIAALKAEVEVSREGARVRLETDGGKIEGKLIKSLDPRFGFQGLGVVPWT